MNPIRFMMFLSLSAVLAGGCKSSDKQVDSLLREEALALSITEKFQLTVTESYVDGRVSSKDVDAIQRQLSAQISDGVFIKIMLGSNNETVKRDFFSSWFLGRESRLGPTVIARITDSNSLSVKSLCFGLTDSFLQSGGRFNEPIDPIGKAYLNYLDNDVSGKTKIVCIEILKEYDSKASRDLLRRISTQGPESLRQQARVALNELITAGSVPRP